MDTFARRRIGLLPVRMKQRGRADVDWHEKVPPKSRVPASLPASSKQQYDPALRSRFVEQNYVDRCQALQRRTIFDQYSALHEGARCDDLCDRHSQARAHGQVMINTATAISSA